MFSDKILELSLSHGVLAVQFTPQHITQACMRLIILNIKAPGFLPWVLLTDLNSRFTFFWMDGPTIYHSTEDASTGWSIIMDLLQHHLRVTRAKPGQQAATTIPILARKEIPNKLRWECE